jgi:hypothetical protein
MAKHAYQTERWAVLREYDSWARKNPDLANKGDPILFFSYCNRNDPSCWISNRAARTSGKSCTGGC